jgi:hypothetical protein
VTAIANGARVASDGAVPLRDARTGRGWSQAQAVAAMRRHSDRPLPDDMTLLRQWKRWEAGEVVPSGFYQKIIATVLATSPSMLFPAPRGTWDLAPRPGTSGFRHECESRRNQVQQTISKLQAELDYLNAVLAIPQPVTGW